MPGQENTTERYDPPEEFKRPPISLPTVKEADKQRLFDMYFIMAFIWAVGGNIRDDCRSLFNDFVLKTLPQAAPQLPKINGDNIYEVVVHYPSLQFITWNHLVPDFVYDKRTPYFDLVVPTKETVALNTLLMILSSTSQNVLVNGVTGTGKSLGLLDFLTTSIRGDDPSSSWEYITTVLSAQTKSRDIESRLESKLYKLRSTAIGPTPGKKAIFFIDDLNMPSLEKYGAPRRWSCSGS
ncbi:hypothetical protein AGDE_14959 [Angomonas deanei]|uniref:Dynein heavy chain AAA lid domain/P-loop containing dynein motor region containing protein, putative n=1 Tax=Angomonas deanei TaxID=59799 RepID=A0A7G2CAN9_9TRYP|nr:hypothetical protein AGDE_14959 [Angomonas deanei]CAD2215823.1 Dynein heavy chain AAA lid domain/P-loop containing dynein motor region containing protein, putative [Angomonas deanei]|eukprot:EPY19923.1 hypothetical protein AGDE_14959 [Angomonas deanei]